MQLQPTLITGSHSAARNNKALELLTGKHYNLTLLDHLLFDDLEGVEAILVEDLYTSGELVQLKRALTSSYTKDSFTNIHIIATSPTIRKHNLPEELQSFYNVIEL